MARKDIAKDGKATQFGQPNGNDNTKGGRKPGIKKEIEQLLEKSGQMVIPSKQVIEIKDNGDVVIKLPTKNAIALKYISWAMSNKNKGADMLAKLQEMVDGKAKQSVDVTSDGEQVGIPIINFTKKSE